MLLLIMIFIIFISGCIQEPTKPTVPEIIISQETTYINCQQHASYPFQKDREVKIINGVVEEKFGSKTFPWRAAVVNNHYLFDVENEDLIDNYHEIMGKTVIIKGYEGNMSINMTAPMHGGIASIIFDPAFFVTEIVGWNLVCCDVTLEETGEVTQSNVCLWHEIEQPSQITCEQACIQNEYVGGECMYATTEQSFKDFCSSHNSVLITGSFSDCHEQIMEITGGEVMGGGSVICCCDNTVRPSILEGYVEYDGDGCVKDNEIFSYIEYPNGMCCDGSRTTDPFDGMENRPLHPFGICTGCGDGTCHELENIENCPEDCSNISVVYTTNGECWSACQDDGYKSGSCYWPSETTTIRSRFKGACQSDPEWDHCANNGDCFCYCQDTCAVLGENGPSYSLGPLDPFKDVICCEGLILRPPKYAYNSKCEVGEGYGTFCISCGDRQCDNEYEDRCNCPEDCG